MSKPVLFDRPVAHRGLHDRASGIIENTASAFEAAIGEGFAIECDLQLTKDGFPVVFHDDRLERLTGRQGYVRDLTAAEMTALPLLDSAAGDRPQHFHKFLAQIGGRTMLQVELKRQKDRQAAETLARRAAEALADYKGPVTVESFDPTLIALIRRFGFRGKVGIITYGYNEPEWDKDLSNGQRFALRHLLHWPWTRFDFISARYVDLKLPAIQFWRSLGIPVTAWTVRSAADAAAVKSLSDQIVFEGFDPRG